MQFVLSLDFSSQPAEMVVSTVSAGVVEVVERRTLPFGRHEILTEMTSQGIPSAVGGATPETTDEGATPAADARLTAMLRHEIGFLSTAWSNCILVVPDAQFLGLTVELPFKDNRSIERVIDLEVQDVVPFDVSDSLIQHSVLTGRSTPPFEVFVGLLPRRVVAHALAIVQDAGLEPQIITTPGSALGAVLRLAPNYFKSNCILLVAEDPHYSLALVVGGEVKSERTIERALGEFEASDDDTYGHLLLSMRLSIASTEQKYGQRIEAVYIFGAFKQTHQLQQILGRPVEVFSASDVIKAGNAGGSDLKGLGAISSFFAPEEAPAKPLCDFRVRDFSYNARFQELQRGLKSLSSHALAALLSILFVIGAIYFARERYYSSQNEALLTQIRKVIPSFTAQSANILTDLRTQETKLSEELGVLGSPSRVTPLDVLANISKDLPEMPGLQVTLIRISGGRATLDGVAPDLSAVDKIQKALRQNRTAYEKVTAQTGAASASTKGYRFSLELLLKQ